MPIRVSSLFSCSIEFFLISFFFFSYLLELFHVTCTAHFENAANWEPDELVQQARHYFCRNRRNGKLRTDHPQRRFPTTHS
ncbi:Uncharacterized protein HZ326_28294 [Fusarium oxysporum f. sp. albedinis]|nr:Uncharacterized protein HZ326_28294 [Fusarium oxysporum f. sp. albedinis]